MKKLILFVILLSSITLVEATVASVNVTWQVSPSTLRPSSIATISLTLSNSGGVDLTNIVVKATAGQYITITSGDKLELGGLASLLSTQGAISIKVDENAPSTTSYVYLEIDYYTSTSTYEKTFYIPLTIVREPILQIKNVNLSDNPEPGKTVSLSFDLKNEGFGAAKDIIVSITPNSNFIVSSSSGEFFIDSISKLETKTLSFPITVSPEIMIGTTSIPIKLIYYDEIRSNIYNQTKEIGLKISGNVDFMITVNSYNNFYYGRSGKVSLSIANRGSSEANYISVKAFSDFGSKEFYIGSLDSDDSETIELPQDLSKASGKYLVNLILNYRDKFENSYSIENSIEVIPTNAPLDYNIIIVVSVVLVIIFWIYRRRKK
jgi:hypothetical protein